MCRRGHSLATALLDSSHTGCGGGSLVAPSTSSCSPAASLPPSPTCTWEALGTGPSHLGCSRRLCGTSSWVRRGASASSRVICRPPSSDCSSLDGVTRISSPLVPGLLSSSLRELVIGGSFGCLILPDALPTRLKLLAFGNAYRHSFTPGVLPMGLLALDVGRYSQTPLVRGGIPATVRYLCLPRLLMRDADDEMLPTDARLFRT